MVSSCLHQHQLPPAGLQKELGLDKDLVFADPKAPRFVLWNGKLRAAPSSPPSLLKTDLLSTRGKARAVLGALGLKPRAPGAPLNHGSSSCV